MVTSKINKQAEKQNKTKNQTQEEEKVRKTHNQIC